MTYRPSPIVRSRRVLALDFIRRYYLDHGSSPSFSEIAAALTIKTQHVGPIIRALVASGEISWTPGQSRSITLPELLENYGDQQLMLELMRRGWIVNPERRAPINRSGVVTKSGVPLDALMADTGAKGDGDVACDDRTKRKRRSAQG